MRMLLLTERYPPDIGGVARSAGRIAGALADLGHEVHVLAFTRQLPAGRAERCAPGAGGGPTLHRLGQFAASDTTLQMAAHLIDHLHATVGIELVWGHYLHPAGFAAVLNARRLGVASIVSARGNDVDRLLYPPGDFARLTFTLQHADLVTAVSNDLAAKIDLVRPGVGSGVTSLPVHVLPNVVDSSVFCHRPPATSLRERLGILPDEAVLCFSGELRFKKGIEFLLAALAEVVRHRPACLLVLGQARAEDQARLAEFAAQSPAAAARIVFTGHQEDPAAVAEHLCLADAYLQPSLWDGMPNALLEAMACGLPCIASTAGAMPEVIDPGENGFLLPVHALHRLGDAILDLLAQPAAVRAAIGAAARRRMLAAFAPTHERARLAELIAAVSDRVPRS